MENLLIVANWKSNKTATEALEWLENFKIGEASIGKKEVVICPSFTSLQEVYQFVSTNRLPLKIGAQDVSPFEEGSFTGAVNAIQLNEFVNYVIIGHSERREEFNEGDDVLGRKVSAAISQKLVPIYCVSDEEMLIPTEVTIVAFEPLAAIGSGNPKNPAEADLIAKKIKASNKNVTHVLYGGSVTSENVSSFTNMENIDGVLVGKASLDESEFLKIVQNA